MITIKEQAYNVICSQSNGNQRTVFIRGYIKENGEPLFFPADGCNDASGCDECERCKAIVTCYANGLDASSIDSSGIFVMR